MYHLHPIFLYRVQEERKLEESLKSINHDFPLNSFQLFFIWPKPSCLFYPCPQCNLQLVPGLSQLPSACWLWRSRLGLHLSSWTKENRGPTLTASDLRRQRKWAQRLAGASKWCHWNSTTLSQRASLLLLTLFQEKLETQIFMYNLFIFSQVQKMV